MLPALVFKVANCCQAQTLCVCLCDEMLFVCVGDIFPAPNERDKLKQMIIDPRFIRPASVQKFKFIPSFQRWYSYV